MACGGLDNPGRPPDPAAWRRRATIGLSALALLLAACSSGYTAGPATVVRTTSTTARRTGANITTPADTTINPKVMATPDKKLVDGQRITVSVTGFGDGSKVWLSECASAVEANNVGCGPELPQQTLLVTDDNRRGVASFVVHDRASARGYDTTDVQPCVSACVLVAAAGAFAGYPNAKNYAYTRLSFVRVLSSTRNSRRPAVLEAPDSLTPAAGICRATTGPIAVVVWVGGDDVPQPRCMIVSNNQRLGVQNRTAAPINVVLGHLVDTSIAPGQTYILRDPVGMHLAPGVHSLIFTRSSSADIWVDAKCARPPNADCVTP